MGWGRSGGSGDAGSRRFSTPRAGPALKPPCSYAPANCSQVLNVYADSLSQGQRPEAATVTFFVRRGEAADSLSQVCMCGGWWRRRTRLGPVVCVHLAPSPPDMLPNVACRCLRSCHRMAPLGPCSLPLA